MSAIQVNLFHIFLLSPILVYIGYNKDNSDEKIKWMFVGITLMMPFIVRVIY